MRTPPTRLILSVVVMAGVALLAVAALRAVSLAGDEKMRLTLAILKLDTALVASQVVARDPERYRLERDQVTARLQQIGVRMQPDLEAFYAAFPPLGVQVERGPVEASGLYARHPVTLRGLGRETLAAAGGALQQSPVVYDDVHLSLGEDGRWSRSGAVLVFLPGQPPPPGVPEPRWYSRVNGALWDELKQKEEAYRAVDGQFGLSDFDASRSRLEDMLNVYRNIQPRRLNFEPLMARAFLGATPLVSAGELTAPTTAEGGVVLRGSRAHPLPATPDTCCRLLRDEGGDPWVTTWELATTSTSAQPPAAPVPQGSTTPSRD